MNHLAPKGKYKNSKYIYIFFLPVVYSTDLGVWSLKAEFVDIAKMRCPDERGLLLQAPQDPKDSSCLSTEDQYH